MTAALEIVIFAILGLNVGSFLNVCIDRLPAGENVIKLPSHCTSCGRRIAARDLVPILSYLWLRGRCRYCGVRIPPRLLVVELITGTLFALLAWHYGLNLQLAIILIYTCFFIVIFFVDLERQVILDWVTYPAIVLALIFSFFWNGFGGYWPELGITSALLGGAAGLVFMLVPYLISRGGMGGGDVILAALIGLVTGFPLVIVALIIGILSGGAVATVLLLLKVKGRKDPIPFGTFLAAATVATLVWGPSILNWYTSLQ